MTDGCVHRRLANRIHRDWYHQYRAGSCTAFTLDTVGVVRSVPVASYQDAVAFLDSRIGYGIRPGLDRMHAVLRSMGDPQRAYQTVQVAGTNGKTTVTWTVEALLREHGYRAASYTSPHLEHVEDRYRVGGRPITRQGLVAAVAEAGQGIDDWEARSDDSLTYFEATVAIAFQMFASAGVDVAAIEVGLGGRLDATNVLNADVAVITSIALDHMHILGDSLGEIAAEKAAILPQNGCLVTGRLPTAAEDAVAARVAKNDAVWFRAGESFAILDAAPTRHGWRVSIDGIEGTYRDLQLPLHGRHQVGNLGTAVAACEVLLGRALDRDALAGALTDLVVPGRIEIVRRRPLVVIDGAHNDEGMAGLARALTDEFPQGRRLLIVGFRGHRDPLTLLRPLAGLFSEVIVTQADDDEALDTTDVAEAAHTLFDGVSVSAITPVAQALRSALDAAADNDIIVVAGSLYVAGEARLAGAQMGSVCTDVPEANDAPTILL